MPSKMLLLVGGDSEIGAATARYLRERGVPVTTTTRRPDRVAAEVALLDLSRSLSQWTPPEGVDAACIFAAISRLAACASDPRGSARINVEQTLVLIERLLARGIYVLFLSTNQVFDGSVAHVSSEAATCPVSEYGRQKARTETALREHMQRNAPVGILRLGKVVSLDMPLIHGWIEALSAGQPIHAFHDLTMAPTPAEMVASTIALLLRERAAGIWQLTGPRDVPYADVGDYVADRVGAPRSLVERVSALSSGMPVAATPRHTTLDSTALRERYGIEVPDIRAVIDSVVAHQGK